MTQKIKQIFSDLAIKSGLAEDMGRGYRFPDNYVDFAELIVKECMDLVRDINQEYDGGSTVVNAADEIKEHFGVK